MSRKRVLIAAAVLVLAAAAAADRGHRGPTGIGPGRVVGSKATVESPVLHAHVQSPVSPGAPGSAQDALYRFALTYANLTAQLAPRRYRRLILLAAPPLANDLQRAAPRAEFDALRGLPAGAEIEGTILNLEFGAQSARLQHASVVLEQRLRRAGGSVEAPVDTAFVAELVRRGRSWLVADFTPVP